MTVRRTDIRGIAGLLEHQIAGQPEHRPGQPEPDPGNQSTDPGNQSTDPGNQSTDPRAERPLIATMSLIPPDSLIPGGSVPCRS